MQTSKSAGFEQSRRNPDCKRRRSRPILHRKGRVSPRRSGLESEVAVRLSFQMNYIKLGENKDPYRSFFLQDYHSNIITISILVHMYYNEAYIRISSIHVYTTITTTSTSSSSRERSSQHIYVICYTVKHIHAQWFYLYSTIYIYMLTGYTYIYILPLQYNHTSHIYHQGYGTIIYMSTMSVNILVPHVKDVKLYRQLYQSLL